MITLADKIKKIKNSGRTPPAPPAELPNTATDDEVIANGAEMKQWLLDIEDLYEDCLAEEKAAAASKHVKENDTISSTSNTRSTKMRR